MRERIGTVKTEFIKSHQCPGEWILGRDVTIVDSWREDDYNMLMCAVIMPFSGKAENFRIPEQFIEIKDDVDTRADIPDPVPVADTEQVVHD